MEIINYTIILHIIMQIIKNIINCNKIEIEITL